MLKKLLLGGDIVDGRANTPVATFSGTPVI